MNATSVSPPDPASPWVLTTRELGRRAGAMRAVERVVDLTACLGLDVISAPAGSTVRLDLRMEAVTEGVFVSGTASAHVEGECARCLAGLAEDVEAPVAELYAYPHSLTADTTDEDEVSRVVGELVDTEHAVRDALLLALPLAPLCREDCPGLCPECGERRADLPADHGHEILDPRWAALRGHPADPSS